MALSTSQILSGYRGELWSDSGEFLAEVNTWHAQVTVTNTDYQPAGEARTIAVLQSYHVTLTFTETVVRDTQFLRIVTDALRNKQQPTFVFQGVLRRPDGSTGRYVFRECVPDGAFDIANVSPGQVLERSWSWRVNQPPELQALLGG
jgi:hypothetical protein